MEIFRFYEGPPLDRVGWFHGPWLTVWHMLEGRVVVRAENEEVVAKRGEWLMRKPVPRFQDFSEDARILSVHVVARSRHNAALWQGPALVMFPNDPELEEGVEGIRDTRFIQSMRRKGELNPSRFSCELETYLAYREAALRFFYLLLRRLGTAGITFDAPEIHDERVRESLRALLREPDFSQPFSREALAADYGLSPSRFGRLWQRELGMTPNQFWETQKLEYVQDLLQNTETPIKEICYQSGFAYLSQFSLWFKRLTGESPRAYRKRYAGNE